MNEKEPLSLSQWVRELSHALGTIPPSSDDHLLEGRIRREKILLSLSARERTKAHAHQNNAALARQREAHEKGIEEALAWLNAHGFPAFLENGTLTVEGFGEAREP
jgi:hypothetical protein